MIIIIKVVCVFIDLWQCCQNLKQSSMY